MGPQNGLGWSEDQPCVKNLCNSEIVFLFITKLQPISTNQLPKTFQLLANWGLQDKHIVSRAKDSDTIAIFITILCMLL